MLEPSLELVAPIGSQTMHNNAHSVDRFSDLPDHIVHHILSSLEITDIAWISILSSRFRELCMSAPNFKIDSEKVRGSIMQRLRFVNFLDRFLNLRNRMEVQTFCLRWVFQTDYSILDEEFRIDTWIHNVVRCNVKELDLNLLNRTFVLLPLCISSCGSLRVLKLNMNNGILKLPSVGFPTLQDLTLSSFRIVHNDFGEWVSSLCKSLTTLYLTKFCGIKNLSISSSSLESLTINKAGVPDDLCRINVSAEKLQIMNLCWFYASSTGKSLNVSAPNLRRLSLEGHHANYYCLVNFTRLQTALIYCHTPPPQFTWSTSQLASTDQSLFGVVRSISQAKVLIIGGKFIQSLITRGFPPTTLYNLHRLCLNVKGLEDDLVPSIASFLRGLPSLKALSIKSYGKSAASKNKLRSPLPLKASGFGTEYWESQNLVFVHQQLKVAEIELHCGENEMKLVKYLLKHAKALKKLTIFCSPLEFSRLYKISKRINKFKRASSTASVHILLK